MKLRIAAAVLVCAASSACEPTFAYAPRVGTTTMVDGNLAAQFSIPPEAPRGHVWIESSGIVDLSPEGSDEDIHVLHVRAVIENESDDEWTFDTREQQVIIEGGAPTYVAFANADAGSEPPVLNIARRTKRAVDLFFALPSDLEEDADLPRFDAVWRVETPDESIAKRTPFERVEGGSQSYATGYDDEAGPYWGGPYWYNPYYPRFAFVIVGPRRSYGHGFVFHGGHVFHGRGFHGGAPGGFHGGGHSGGHGHH